MTNFTELLRICIVALQELDKQTRKANIAQEDTAKLHAIKCQLAELTASINRKA